MKVNYSIICMMVSITLLSCYDDLGNYSYNNDINDFKAILEDVYGVRKMDTVLLITPDIQQSHIINDENLDYLWFSNTTGDNVAINKWDTVGNEKTLRFSIQPDEKNFSYKYYLRLEIIDKTTNARQLIQSRIEVSKPYEKAWMVLHEKEGQGYLGCVEYVGKDTEVNFDAYYRETNTRLKGIPYKLGVMNNVYYNWGHEAATQFIMITSDPEESGILAQDKKFENVGSIDRMIPKSEDYAAYEPSSVSFIGKNTGGPLMICNGKAFQGSENVPVMISSQAQQDVLGPINITKAGIGAHIWLLYDSEGHRFLQMNTRNNIWNSWAVPSGTGGLMEYISKTTSSVTLIDSDNIGFDKDVVYIGGGYYYGRSIQLASWQRYAIYAFAKSNVIGKSYVFEFHSRSMTSPSDDTDPAPFSNYYVINTPAGLTTNTLMTSSSNFNRILFYTVGNKIYKLDFASTGGLVTLIYQHPDPEAQISALKMAHQSEYYAFENELHPSVRTLGAAFTLSDGSGELVVLYLNGAGKVDTSGETAFPSIQQYNKASNDKKFGVIKDIAFI